MGDREPAERLLGHRGSRPKAQITIVRRDQFPGQSIGFDHHSRIGWRRWRRDRMRRHGKGEEGDKTGK
ncbi:MAG: hypothetical protein A2885_12710 [Sphingopyxis sp. RIFCSPHIGHO2_01_FULL_65_24]|nr:MAG: hypothetical protein A2885_12710 [Sphingopyxis sp. RIFCSPHIGHO2_01_FULL_65_24]